jgi:UDP-glucose 4-epimerase
MDGRGSAEMIAVTGANGWLGREVCLRFERNRVPVRALVRRPARGTETSFDLCDPRWESSWPRLLEGCGAIVHCAAHVHRPNETPAEKRLFWEINAVGTERLLRAAAAAGVGRFILASTIAVYDWSRRGATPDETAATAPVSAYGESKMEAERVVQASVVDWRIARLATIYGDGDIANFGRLAAALRRGRFILPGKGEARKSVVTATRAAEILCLLAKEEGRSNFILNIAAPTAPSLAEICDAFARVCNFPLPRRAPRAVMSGFAALGDLIAKTTLRPPLTSGTLAKLTESTVVDASQLSQIFPRLAWPDFEESLRPFCAYYSQL